MTSKQHASMLVGEFIGTAFLLMTVVGSGIMAQQLSTDVGVQLLMNAFATAGVLVALILTFANVSGAKFNPLVTLVDFAAKRASAKDAALEIGVQVAGAVGGVMAANIMFELPVVNLSTRSRSTLAITVAEFIATFGLLIVIFLTAKRGDSALVAVAVGGYIAGAYFFTSSTSFANPAVTIARTLSDTFAGIAPTSAIRFVLTQLIATGAAIPVIKLLAQDGVPAQHD
jgi:glycerol uptake facilitator-like aquaporin